MRRLLLMVSVLVIGAGLYVASPFRAAWALREAIKTGDTRTIERKIEWKSVRESLRKSLAHNPRLLPEVNKVGAEIRPTMWQRVKWAFGSSMLDRFLETYVTPEGMHKLYKYRMTWNSHVKGLPPDDSLPLPERLKKFYSRILRAEFLSPTRFEIEIVDKDTPTRAYVGLFELDWTEWKLTSLKIANKV
ncbi:MAG: DUF2939 domain-containing protein [Hyphomicrobiaceae bacterium]